VPYCHCCQTRVQRRPRGSCHVGLNLILRQRVIGNPFVIDLIGKFVFRSRCTTANAHIGTSNSAETR
jgi:hypothetical protein